MAQHPDRTTKMLMEGKKRFIQGFAKQLQEMHRILVELALETSYGDAHALLSTSFYRFAHTIKGSAPFFGYHEIGQTAAQLVEQWEWASDKEEKGESPKPEELTLLLEASRQLMLQLKHELELSEQEFRQADEMAETGVHVPAIRGSKLLVIDDDDVLRGSLVIRLQMDGYEVDHAADVETAKRLLREKSYDLITLDLLMYPDSGYKLFEFLKGDPTLKWTPLIILSGRDDMRDKVQCFTLGADDYVTKPFQYEELGARIFNLLNRVKNYEQLAYRDPLTGVFNRRYFDHQVTMEQQRVSRYSGSMSIAFIDIDRFKSINDTYGHHIGDLVLQGLAHVLQRSIRSTDLLARFGGEEFVIVFPGSSGVQAQRVVESILETVRNTPVAETEGQSYSVTFSAGIAEWSNDMSTESWLVLADEAMYQAKKQGRNRVLLADGLEVDKAAASDRHRGDEPTVLVVESNELLRSFITSRLSTLPLRVLQVSDDQSALQSLEQNRVQLCILDAGVCCEDGKPLIRKLLQLRKEKAIASELIVISGKKHWKEAERSLQEGVGALVGKPFSPLELELQVKRLLGMK
ncbi:diguanylate cyclase [Paenibacillus turpanensis]|uniref:diguanylate cyclase n=1 Tax=Paenibacillus turpanensis TaxID=2689078 RepID=UPI00140E0A52|nr:diguanylate cyclase [Paenibacillus turpanensis]